jgi:endoglucanase
VTTPAGVLRAAVLGGALAGALALWPVAGMTAGTRFVTPQEWHAYAEAFVAPSGRIVDTGNGGISHSEGQGYGLLLAYLAGMREDFDRIWRFTLTEMMIRDDGLVAWKWDPGASPNLTDLNNASDGDILIAYALELAGEAWGVPAYSQAATDLTRALGEAVLLEEDGALLLLPGVTGFGVADRPDGPVVNASYWVFEAFPVLGLIDPDHDWSVVARSGEDLVREVRLGARQLPPDWLSLATLPRPADGFAPEFGYNSLRIPLYLIRAGADDPALLARFKEGMSSDGGVGVIDLMTGRVVRRLDEPGYRAIPALIGCVLGDGPLPAALSTFEPTHYYPSTLHLLVLSHARKELPQCL